MLVILKFVKYSSVAIKLKHIKNKVLNIKHNKHLGKYCYCTKERAKLIIKTSLALSFLNFKYEERLQMLKLLGIVL